jgi:colanic acid/amylovoran biosynthesis glycosyltransferase
LKRVYLLTSHFPYLRGEDFLEAELAFVPKGVALRLLPVNACGGAIPTKRVPDGMAAAPLFKKEYTPLEKLLDSARALLRPAVWREIAFLVRSGRANVANLETLVVFCAAGERILRAIRRTYGAELRDTGADACVYSFWLNKSAYAAALLKRGIGCRVVARAHGHDLYESPHTQPYQPMRRFLLETLDLVATVSEAGRRHLVDRDGHADKVVSARLGTPDRGVRSPACRAPFTVVTVANLIPIKRVGRILEGLGLVRYGEIRWVHFGAGEEEGRLRADAERLPANVTLEMRGHVPHDDLMRFYRETDVHLFVNASSTEGIPVSIMEALSFGVPVLATAVGGTGELVQDGANGRLLPADASAERIAEGVREFMEMDYETYATFRAAARASWERSCSAERNYPAFYRDVVGV